MNSRHKKTLAAVLAKPTSATIRWAAIEAMIVALGATVREGSGSRVEFTLNGVITWHHRPHPGKEAKPYQVRLVAGFLAEAGVITLETKKGQKS